MSKPLTPAQQRVLEELRRAPLVRARWSYEWVSNDGSRFSSGVVASLRKRGLVTITKSKERRLTTATIKQPNFDESIAAAKRRMAAPARAGMSEIRR